MHSFDFSLPTPFSHKFSKLSVSDSFCSMCDLLLSCFFCIFQQIATTSLTHAHNGSRANGTGTVTELPSGLQAAKTSKPHDWPHCPPPHNLILQVTGLLEATVKNEEQRTKNKEHRIKNTEQRTQNREHRTKNKEQRIKSKQPTPTANEQKQQTANETRQTTTNKIVRGTMTTTFDYD